MSAIPHLRSTIPTALSTIHCPLFIAFQTCGSLIHSEVPSLDPFAFVSPDCCQPERLDRQLKRPGNNQWLDGWMAGCIGLSLSLPFLSNRCPSPRNSSVHRKRPRRQGFSKLFPSGASTLAIFAHSRTTTTGRVRGSSVVQSSVSPLTDV